MFRVPSRSEAKYTASPIHIGSRSVRRLFVKLKVSCDARSNTHRSSAHPP